MNNYSLAAGRILYDKPHQTNPNEYTFFLPLPSTQHELYKQAVELLYHHPKSHEEEISELEDLINNAGWD
jgi:hypothetical protein